MEQQQSGRRGFSRRTVLKHGTVVSTVGLVGASAFAGGAAAQSCDRTVSAGGGGDHTTIQAAVDAAAPGETICVGPGTYAEAVGVDKEVDLAGQTDPDGPNPAVVDGSIEVSASDATVSGLKVAPTTTFVAGGVDPYGILVTGELDGVTVEGNVVEGMTADSDGGSVTINGIQVWNDGPTTQTGTVVRDNVVRDMHNRGDASAGWPNYGGAAAIKVQGVVEDTSVTGNTVERVHSAGWTYGVVTTHTGNAPGVSPLGTTVARNTIEEVNDGSVYDVAADPASAPYPGVAVGIDGDSLASEATANLNDFLQTPVGAQNKDEANTLDAECNYWGHATGPETDDNENGKGAAVQGRVDYTPWNKRQIGRGRNPGNSCVGGRGT